MTDKHTSLVTLARDHDGFGSVNPPTYRASTILFDSFEAFDAAYHGRAPQGLGYGRHGNPTVLALRDAMSALIDADHTILTPSGLLAITTAILAFVKQGDHILVADSVYGPTRSFCDKALAKMGVQTRYYDPEITPDAFEALIQDNTRVVFMEAPGSLTFEMQDVRGISEVAHRHDCVTMLDYTWATPLYVQPFDLGVDIAIQAVTKYVAGHSDVVMGAASCKAPHKAALAQASSLLGNYVTGDECTLTLRGMRTMGARLNQQLGTTHEVIEWLQAQPEVSEILYPPLETDRGHALWKSHYSGACALFGIVFDPSLGRERVAAFCDALHHFGMGFSWGGYESLIVPFKPAEIRTATKQKWDDEQWIVRMHIGLEAPKDLIADIAGGFEALRAV